MKLYRLFSDETGSTLVEGMAALAVIAAVITIMFSLIGVITLNRQVSAENFQQGSELVCIQDEAAARVKQSRDKSSYAVSGCIVEVLMRYDHWRCNITPKEKGLYAVQYIYSGRQGERIYESQIFAGTAEE